MAKILVIGGGPAGLMAAETAAEKGHDVTIAEAKPTLARKFLMAGKSGLNLTKNSDSTSFLAAYPDADPRLLAALRGFGPAEVMDWATSLDQPIFTGSTGRVFPVAMKASPLLRAWIGRLQEAGVVPKTRWQWLGPTAGGQAFRTTAGAHVEPADATILALGGASWPRLGSDGAWAEKLAQHGVAITPFRAANVGYRVDWSVKMARHFGHPVKNVALSAGGQTTRGEFVITPEGIEGGGVYEASYALSKGARLFLDLQPNRTIDEIASRMETTRGKDSRANRLRKALKLTPVQVALYFECLEVRPETPEDIALSLKKLRMPIEGPLPMEGAISTSGGIAWDALDDNLMIQTLPGVFAAGEMLDWEAPTGGYLITGCLASGRAAARGADRWLAGRPLP